MRNHDTIAAIATPPGEGGIAIIRVSGPDTLSIVTHVFGSRQRRTARDWTPNVARYGHFRDSRTGEVVDDGILTLYRAPHSYTGEDTAEFSCHGGRAVTMRVLQIVLDAGARLAEPGEFTRRAFLNGRIDLAQAEAVADVIRAQTEVSLRQARRQLEGHLSQAIHALKEDLVGILAAIEVTIDFSDEVGELDYEALEERLRTVLACVARLLSTAEQGRIAREGLRIALIGRPNVGKSSLFNALLKSDRAIVTAIPGTTRDRLEEAASIRGAPFVLVDLAGLRETEDIVERQGVELAESAASSADLALFVLDLTEGVTEEDRAISARLASLRPARCLLVFNKRDVVTPEQFLAVQRAAQEITIAPKRIAVSARTGEGLEALEEAILAQGFGNDLSGALAEPAILSNARHRQALEAAYNNLQEALLTTANRLPGDFVAIDVRGALSALGLVTGETVTEDIIHRIFHDFCVGK
ncbi:MAG TPA: tRNA uridine-5-carboxymethylaminomethyl(34) synthesis GTPase MnmE [Chthonomonadaceae bacterium]|nr:tRNA uridine-5-carboxymethylaminomethyl(34) synthesis GTPase MnmE [Chthonomonadaceae bacterium]